MATKIGKFFLKALNTNCEVYVANYLKPTTSKAIKLVYNDGNCIDTLSTNLPEFYSILKPNEFFVRGFSLLESIREDCLSSGIFEYTGKSIVDTTKVEIWKLL
jgi:hypothetical protein